MKNGEHPFHSLEQWIERAWRGIPHLPVEGRRWLARAAWIIALIGFIIYILNGLWLLSVSGLYLRESNVFGLFISLVNLAFVVIEAIVLGNALLPLKARNKKGWSLLFVLGLIFSLNILIDSLLTLTIFGFLLGIIYGIVAVGIYAYFLFEVRGQFAHNVVEGKVVHKTSTSKK